MRPHNTSVLVLLLLIFLGSGKESFSQGNLYTARGYWEESTRTNYQAIKQKLEKGDSLTDHERNYIQDYELYLQSYFMRMSQDDKDDYARLKAHWDSELTAPKISRPLETNEFEWRARDRIANGLYGLWYGSTVVAISEIKGAGTVGIPLITSGLWMLGPAINPKKYENVTRSTVRANNTGKLLGLGYGAALSLAITGNSENSGKWGLGLSTVGSIVLGEIAFYGQEQRNYSAGHIELMRHYGFLGPWVGFSGMLGSGSNNPNLLGGAILGGGIAGLIIGHRVAKKYDYSRGDVDAISSLTLISTGLGFAAVTGSLNKSSDLKSLMLIPAASAIVATILGQRMVRGAHLTDKQGSTINFSTAGAALMGLGAVALTESRSAAVWIGVPSGLALITHQILLHKYKMKNLELNLQRGSIRKRNYNVSFKVTPENYFLNQRIPVKEYSPQVFARLQNPVFKLVVTF